MIPLMILFAISFACYAINMVTIFKVRKNSPIWLFVIGFASYSILTFMLYLGAYFWYSEGNEAKSSIYCFLALLLQLYSLNRERIFKKARMDGDK